MMARVCYELPKWWNPAARSQLDIGLDLIFTTHFGTAEKISGLISLAKMALHYHCSFDAPG